MDNDNIHDVTYRFKICVSLDDDENALIYLERLVNYIEEYDYEELEIIHRLFKRLIHQKRKLLSKVICLHKELKDQEILVYNLDRSLKYNIREIFLLFLF